VSERRSRFSGLSEALDQDVEELEESIGRNKSRRGRPRGKRSNPDYVQLTSYVREENLDDAKATLMKEKRQMGRKRDVSELIDSLLAFYVQEGDPWELLRGR
jgi:predicted DNA-binding WGR domain protein